MISPNAKPKSLGFFPSISTSSSSLPYLFLDSTFAPAPNPSDHYFYLKASFSKYKHQSQKMPWHTFFFSLSHENLLHCGLWRKLTVAIRCCGGYQKRTVAVETVYGSTYVSRCKVVLSHWGYRKCFHPNMQVTGRSERECSTRESNKPQCGFYRHASSPGPGEQKCPSLENT